MRIDENKIFGAYMDSLLIEKKKKSMPPWLKDKKEGGDSDKKDDKKSDKKEKKLPPWLKKKDKKVVKEEFETIDEPDFGGEVQALLDELKTNAPELFQQLSDYLAQHNGAQDEYVDDEISDAEIPVEGERDGIGMG